MKRGLVSTVLICVGLALLGVGFLISKSALALVPGLALIVIGFTVPVFIKHRETELEPKDEHSTRQRTRTTEHI